MKHTTSYPHQRHQSLARLLLTIWLFTMCSPEATLATFSQSAMAPAASTSTGAPGLPREDTALQQMPPDSSPTSEECLNSNEEDGMEFFQKKGDSAWDKSEDCAYALKKQWDQLIILHRKDLAKLIPDQLNALRLRYAIQAHELYSTSCQEAAKEQDLLNETNLKATMAERLLRLGYPLEAKMYALNMLFRVVMSASSDSKVEALTMAQTLLAKVEEAQTACADEQTATSSPTNTLSTNSEQSPTATATQEGDADPEIRVQWAAAQMLQKTVERLLFSVYKQPALSNLSDLKARSFSLKKLAERYEQVQWRTTMANDLGLTLLIVLLCVGAFYTIDLLAVPILLGLEHTEIEKKKEAIKSAFKVAWEATFEETDTESSKEGKKIVVQLGWQIFKVVQLGWQIFKVELWSFFSFIGALAWRAGILLLAFWGRSLSLTGRQELASYELSLKDKTEKVKQATETCKALNSRLEKHLATALDAYRQGNVQQCLNILSNKYDTDQPALLPEEMSISSFKELIQLLKESGFEQYAIARLLSKKYGFERYIIAWLLIKISANRSAQEAEACKALNSKLEQHLATALEAYHQGNVQQCLDILSNKYDTDQPALLQEKINSDSLKEQTQLLNKYGFGQYAIARLHFAISANRSTQEAEARKALNSRLEQHLATALEAYHQGNVQECINRLSTTYAKDQPPLLRVQEEIDSMYTTCPNNPTTLTRCGFSPSARAWLLIVASKDRSAEAAAQQIFQYVKSVRDDLKALNNDLHMGVLQEWIRFLSKLWKFWWYDNMSALEDFSWSILKIQERLWNLGYPHFVLAWYHRELKEAQKKITQDYEKLETLLKIASMRLASAKGVPQQIAKEACDALRHYLRIQFNRPASQHPMPPLLLAAITDFNAVTEAGALVPAAPDQ